MEEQVTFGRKPVLELVQRTPERVRRITLAEGTRGPAIRELVAAARAAGVPVQYAPRRVVERQAQGGVHQGVVAVVHAVPIVSLDDLLAGLALETNPMLVACDSVTDPHNLGAIARSAAAAGAAGLLLPSRGSAPVTGTVRKAAAGALDRLPVAAAGNLTSALRRCKEAGLWVIGAAAAEAQDVYTTDLTVPLVLVLGSEGKGVRPGVRKQCDLLVSIPLAAGTESLNVSVAAGVVLFEAVRQRRAAAG